MALAHANVRPPQRPRLHRGLVVLSMLLILAAIILKGYQVIAGSGQPLNVLVMGTDEHKTRTDVVILAHWEPQHHLLNLISLPRDTRVNIPCPKNVDICMSPDKLAHAHHYGSMTDQGPQLAVVTVEQFLGIKIDHYVVIDFAGFEKAVEALGGLTIDVDKNMDYDDPYATPPLKIHLKAGVQKLNGQQALQFVRFRNDEMGDIGRIQRTQKFFLALLHSLQDSGNIGRLPAVATSLLPFVQTDLDAGSALALARAGENLTPETLQTVALAGEAKWENNIWFWVANEDRKQEIVQNYITNVQPQAAPPASESDQ